MAKAIDIALQRIKECSLEEPPFYEAVVEAVLVLDLFRKPLGFDKDTAKRQVRNANDLKDRKKPDIILQPSVAGHPEIVVEVKQHDVLTKPRKRETAVGQAAGYAVKRNLKIKLPQRFGIVTDGNRWIYFVVGANNNPLEVRKLLEFSVSDNAQLARKVLQRSHRSTIHKFFQFLEAIHSNMTREVFEVLKDQGLVQRVDYLLTTAKTAGCIPSQADKSIIEELYSGGGATIPSLFQSLPVIEIKPSRRKKKPVQKRKTAANTQK